MKLKGRFGNRSRFSLRSLVKFKLPRRPKAAGNEKAVSLRARLSNLTLMGGRKPAARPLAPVYMVVITPKAEACFELRSDGAVDVDRSALPREGAVIYLFEGGDDERAKADLRLESPKGTRYGVAKEKMLEEIANKARMFQSPDHPTIMYGRDQRTLAAYGQNLVIPGASLIDHLVAPSTQKAWIVPVVLSDTDASTVAVVMCTVIPGKSGSASVHERLQLTNRPGADTRTLVQGFAEQAARKNREFATAEVLELTGADLLRLSTTLRYYPLENEVFGVAASSLMRYGAVAAGVVAGVSIAGNVVMGLEAGYLGISASKAIGDRDQVSQKVNQLLNSRMRALAKAVSVDVDSTVKAAQNVWQPDSLVSIDCTSKGCALRLTANVNRTNALGGAIMSGQLVSSTMDKESLDAILMQAAPAGYRKKEVTINGDGNVITVVYEYQNLDTPARRLLPR